MKPASIATVLFYTLTVTACSVVAVGWVWGIVANVLRG